MADDTSSKTVVLGTHRVCQPSATLSRVKPFLQSMGITRIADVTSLDSLSIPVYQSVRPNAKTLSVSQGKGVTRELAKVSAIMESIEMWHAENPVLMPVYATVDQMQSDLHYSLADIPLAKTSLLHEHLELDWYPAVRVEDGYQSFAPAEYVRLDLTVRNSWIPPIFFNSSNGLASGNTVEEAILHGIYEVIERDSLTRYMRTPEIGQQVALSSVGGVSGRLIQLLQSKGVQLEVVFLDSPTKLPCFTVRMTAQEYSLPTAGHGCHLDKDVALSRAITEAAQSRLTYIAGARDDLDDRMYTSIRMGQLPSLFRASDEVYDFRRIESTHHPSFGQDLADVLRRLRSTAARSPIYVDLTHPEIGIPVVFVLVPGMLFEEGVQ